jgi:hypothetical protein
VNEQRIMQVLDIERQAQGLHENARRTAEQLQLQAAAEAQSLIDRARAAAREEAQQLTCGDQASDECARILAQNDEKNHRMESLAAVHFDSAVSYVLNRIVGRE